MSSLSPGFVALFVILFSLASSAQKLSPQQLFEKKCLICHEGGQGTAAPSLFGQKAEYLLRTMTDFRENKRRHEDFGMMNQIVKNLDPRDMKSLADYLATISPCASEVKIDKPANFQKKLRAGKTVNRTKQCLECHNADTSLTPLIAGQKTGYLKNILFKFKVGKRVSHIFPEMNEIARSLSAEDIDNVSVYLGSLREDICTE